ncbi:EAL and HDOD domain-containing protein [Marinomonas atlantica]|uniref:EAL and HDOD domain-containing protein n=1 Tax=Marinomonas atlantica TaxID=1806668 RepID=UPI00083286AE|nr:HDOD domain-containing protein [Marinomonas atlantica]MCO4786861.1 HDOD domain-containing protein [Marinomonas atlantica]
MKTTTIDFDQLLMAQQPIFDRNRKLFGYELLFRGDQEEQAVFDNPQMATSQVLVNLCTGICELNSQLRQPFFINMTTELVLSDAFFPISPNTVFIEILEDQVITPEFISAIKKWHQYGFRFVLDDYNYSESYQPLLPYMSIVKIDVLSTPPDSIQEEIQRLKELGLKLVAEKVENELMLSLCLKMGFDYFQGYYLSRPEIIKGKRIESDTQSALRLLNILQNPDVSVSEVSKLVEQTPALSFQMLRLLNSPVVGLSVPVASIKEAVTFLGLTQLKRWTMLITLSSNNQGDPDDIRKLLARARCCELLALQSKKICEEEAFMVGLMSGMDVILQVPKDELLKQIMLTNELKGALSHYEGSLGRVLYSVECMEQGLVDKLAKLPVSIRGQLGSRYFESLAWAKEILATLK